MRWWGRRFGGIVGKFLFLLFVFIFSFFCFFFFQAEDGIRDVAVTGVQTCALPIFTNIGTLFAFILVCFGVNVLRRVAPERPRPFRVPFVPVFPILGVLMCLVLM